MTARVPSSPALVLRRVVDSVVGLRQPQLDAVMLQRGAIAVYCLFRVVQRERGGVIAGERMRDMKGPAGRLPGGAWCSWCRRGAHSADMTSLTAARAAVWSTIFLPVT